MSTINQRLTEYLEQQDVSARQVSLAIGKYDTYLANALKKGSSISVDIISNICHEFPNLNPAWLLTGKGEMIVSEEDQPRQLTIDEAIDKKIDARFGGLEEIVRQLLADMISDELANARNALEKSKNGS